MISDDFMVTTSIKFKNDTLSNFIENLIKNKTITENNADFIFFNEEKINPIIANTILKKYNKFFISVSIFEKVKGYSLEHPQFTKDIILHSGFIDLNSIPLKPTNTPKLLTASCTYDRKQNEFKIRIENVPVKIFLNTNYKSLNEFRNSTLKVLIDFSEDKKFAKDGLNVVLNYDFEIEQIVLYHNSNFILAASKFNKHKEALEVYFDKFN